MHHDFLFSSLDSKQPNTARKVHIRRVYDILHLSLQRHDLERARKAWAILARCKEFDWKSMWTIGVHLLSPDEHQEDFNPLRIDFLRTLMLQHPDQKDSILRELILRLIQSERYKEALDELELYLPSFPYHDNPVLHTYAGLICLYLAQQQAGATTSFDPTVLRDAQVHLERAKSLDPHNLVSEAFLGQISFLLISSKQSGSSEHDSGEEGVDVGITGKPAKRARR